MGTLKKELQLAKDIEELTLKYRNGDKPEESVNSNPNIGNNGRTEDSVEVNVNLESSNQVEGPGEADSNIGAGNSAEELEKLKSNRGRNSRIGILPMLLLTIIGVALLAGGIMLMNSSRKGSDTSTAAANAAQPVFKTLDGKMQLTAPEGWEALPISEKDITLGIRDKDRTQVILMINKFIQLEGQAPRDLCLQAIEVYKMSQDYYEFGEPIDCKVGRYDAVLIECSVTKEGFTFRQLNYFIITKQGDFYLIVGSAEKVNYPKYKENLQKIIDTLAEAKK